MASFLLDVLLPIRIDQPFTYEAETFFEQGQLVIVPFRGINTVGLLYAIFETVCDMIPPLP